VRWYHSVIYIKYVQNDCMFRPSKRAIIRLLLEPVIRHIQWEYGGEKISYYIIHVGLKYMLQWGFPIIHYKGVIKHIPICCSQRSRWSDRVLWQGVLCGWEDAGSDVIPARWDLCVNALHIYPVTILGAGCPVRSGARCGMFTVQVACENVVSRGESVQLGWL
jgi:hypothetical protein